MIAAIAPAGDQTHAMGVIRVQEPGTSQPPPFEPTTDPTPEQKNWLLALHLSPLVGFVIPFGNIVGPLIVWLIKRDEIAVIRQHGPAVLNFHISMTIWMALAWLSMFLLVGFVILPVLGIYYLVMVILGTIDAQNGKLRTYPLSIPFIK